MQLVGKFKAFHRMDSSGKKVPTQWYIYTAPVFMNFASRETYIFECAVVHSLNPPFESAVPTFAPLLYRGAHALAGNFYVTTFFL